MSALLLIHSPTIGQYETTLIKLSNAETQIDDLKVQLDDALGAEEMLVQLTERNLMLGEKIEEMRITIEDLEALKELNDELEENHIETEKALQDEMGTYHVVAQQSVLELILGYRFERLPDPGAPAKNIDFGRRLSRSGKHYYSVPRACVTAPEVTFCSVSRYELL